MNEGLSFKLGSIPVTIGWWFFLLGYFLASSEATALDQVVAIAVILVSILWHELGHAAAFKLFGGDPAIKLYGMGGVTWDRSRNDYSAGKHFLISFAGPLFGFLIGVPALLAYWFLPALEPYKNTALVEWVLWVNLGWSIFNLFPIYPLDGGQMLTSLFRMAKLSVKWPAMISMLLAAALAAASFAFKYWFGVILFAMLFMSSLQLLNASDRAEELGHEPW